MIRLLRFEILSHDFFKPQVFEFTNDVDLTPGPYITMFIGPNGSGKSQILAMVLEIFNSLAANLEQDKPLSKLKYSFNLHYKIDSRKVILSYTATGWDFTVNNKNQQLDQTMLPANFLACAINLNDRYPFLSSRNKHKNSRYIYLGVKSTSNSAFINYNPLIERLSTSLDNDQNIKSYKKLFEKIGLQHQLRIKYKAGQNYKIFKQRGSSMQNLKIDEFTAYFNSLLSNRKEANKMSIRFDKYSKILHDKNLMSLAVAFINRDLFSYALKKSFSYEILIDFIDILTVSDFKQNAEALRILTDLEIIKIDGLILNKVDSKYSFEQASSGEHHIISNFINIMSFIKSKSLIFIDEPEISLHPNWQIIYMNLLQEVFKDYKDCHFFISTHSHFLVSDLQAEKSSLISFNFDDAGFVYNQTLSYETFGWSAENILYKVFGVSTVRNFYFEMDLRELLSMIADNSEDKGRMTEILNRLKSFTLSKNDPLLQIIETANNYLTNIQ